jgi:RNA polymerase sigma-70 factor (ECF subfamily)
MSAQLSSPVLVWQETSTLLEGKDESATLESVVREHARFVFKVAYGVLRNCHDAEDVVQEVFLRVHRSGTKEVCDIRGWLARIAFRLAIDRIRKPETLDLADMDVPARNPSAEQQAMHHQQVVQAQQLIVALPEELRYPLVLSAIEELSSRQIAEMLGIPESSVRGRIMRARQMLREKLAAITEQRR